MASTSSIFEVYNNWRHNNHLTVGIGKEFVEFFGYLEANNFMLIQQYKCKICERLTTNVNYKNEHICTDCSH